MAFGGNSNFESLFRDFKEYMDVFESEELSYASESTAGWQLMVIKSFGQLEGQRLKSLGLVRSEFNELLKEYFELFQLEISDTQDLKVPFEGKSLLCREKAGSSTEAAVAFFENLFSVYGGIPVFFEIKNMAQGEVVLRVRKNSEENAETKGGFKPSREFRHKINNYLSGILSLSSLLRSRHPQIEEMQLIEDSAQKLKAALNPDGI